MGRPLRISVCRRACSWSAVVDEIDGEQVFACHGCGSEWIASEEWTPVDWTGNVPESVQRERSRGRG